MKLTAELFEQLQNCASADEVIEKAKIAGIDIVPERAEQLLKAIEFGKIDVNNTDLDSVAGGCSGVMPNCPKCEVSYYVAKTDSGYHYAKFKCYSCGTQFERHY